MLEFTKYHALGNDFIVVPWRDPWLMAPHTARALCDRHRGIGADGVLLVSPSSDPDHDAQMIVINSDGSRPEMCGNGLRCVAYHLAQQLTSHACSLEVTVRTDAGTRPCLVSSNPTESTAQVTVDMGPASRPSPIDLDMDGTKVRLLSVSVGNPHAVLWAEVSDPEFQRLGPALAEHSQFPDGVNVGFAAMRQDGLELRVWERGAGPTLACGTAACAAFLSAAHLGLASLDRELTVNLPGGTLWVSQDSETGRLTAAGPATRVFEGTVDGAMGLVSEGGEVNRRA